MQIGQYILETNSILGEGNSARVILGTECSSGNKVAVKVVNINTLSDKVKRMVEQEIKTLRRLPSNPNTIKLIDVIEKDNVRYIIQEFIEEGDLFDFVLSNHHSLNEAACKKIFHQMAVAVAFLHKYGIVHHDITLENTGIRRNGQVVLMDFGYCCDFSNDTVLSKFCGTISYCAPELLLGKPYKPAPIDVWSLGVALFVLLVKKFPFEYDNPDVLYKQATSRDYLNSLLQTSLVPDDARDLFWRIFVPNPAKRITAAEILRHRWFQGMDSDDCSDIVKLSHSNESTQQS